MLKVPIKIGGHKNREHLKIGKHIITGQIERSKSITLEPSEDMEWSYFRRTDKQPNAYEKMQ